MNRCEEFPPVPLEFYLAELPPAPRVRPLRAMRDLVGFGCDRRELQERVEWVFEMHTLRAVLRHVRSCSPSERSRWIDGKPPAAHAVLGSERRRESMIEKAEEELVAYVKKATGQNHLYRLCNLLKAFSPLIPDYSPAFEHNQLNVRHLRRVRRAAAR